jgi:hypothetical protein
MVMKKHFSLLTLSLLSIILLSVTVQAAGVNPPKSSGKIKSGSFASVLAQGGIRNVKLVDNWGITYYLTLSGTKSGGTISGETDNTYDCGYGKEYFIVNDGSYQGINYTFTVTSEPPCITMMYYIVDGVADLQTKTGSGTYDWYGDGIDGTLNLTYVGPWE